MMRKLVTIFALMAACFCQAQETELVLPVGHSSPVRFAAFSPDNQYVLTAGDDKQIIVWEAFTGIKLKSLSGEQRDIKQLGFSPDGKYIHASTDSTVSVWQFPGLTKQFVLRDVRGFLTDPATGSIYVHTYAGMLEKRALNGRLLWAKPFNADKLADVSADGKLIILMDEEVLTLVMSDGRLLRKVPAVKLQQAFFLTGRKALIMANEQFARIYDYAKDSITGGTYSSEKWYVNENRRFLVGADMFPPYIRLFDLENGTEIKAFNGTASMYDTLAVEDSNGTIRLTTGSVPIPLPGMREYFSEVAVSDNGKYVSAYGNLWRVDLPDSSYELLYDQPQAYYFRGSFSRDSRYLLLPAAGNRAVLWDIRSRKLIQTYQNKAAAIQSIAIDPGGKILASAEGTTCKLVDIKSGKTKHTLKSHRADIGSVLFSPDGKTVLTNAYDTTACLWNVNDGSLIERFEGHFYESNPVYFAPDGSIVRPPAFFDTITITDVVTGEESFRLHPVVEKNPANFCVTSSASGKYRYLKISPRLPAYVITNTSFDLGWDQDVNTISNDEKTIAFAFYWTDSLHLADPVTGTWTRKIKIPFVAEEREYAFVTQLLFTPDDKHLLIVHRKGSITVLDSEYRFVKRLSGELCRASMDGDLLCILNNGKIDVYDASTLQPLYTYVSINDADYLVVDPFRRYDGTLPARQLLYFTCANEVIGLDQFKDRLWVPGLAGRIIDKDSIYTPGIDRLDICGYAPRIQSRGTAGSRWEFLVRPGTGGLGESAIYVNGVEVKRVPASRLLKTGSAFILQLDSAEIVSYYAPGQNNSLAVRSFVADNSVSSRGFERKDSIRSLSVKAPSLYAVMIGVSDYKGSELDLKYAAKDASDLAAALKIAASKLLNTDGTEHVFVYRVTTDENRYRMPEKLAIQKTIEEIGRKATPNDILLIFFAGHGVMHQESKQFYFLTSEASETSSGSDLGYSGISTAELIDWIKPSVLKAQKRILIFDACNSGQAIRDLVKVGEPEQGYISARNDDGAQQVKLIEKLNERAGFTILSAAASDQSAYEFGEYSQGLLTYALLKSVKETPDVLVDGKYLDVGRWFQAAGTTVEQLIRSQKMRQEPQIISNTNFIIGLVDREVMDSIHLPSVKKAVVSSIVTDPALGFDRLGISKKLDAELALASAGNNATFIFRQSVSGDRDVYSLNGIYSIAGEMISLKISLVKDREVIDILQLEGKIESVDTLVRQVVEWLQNK